MKNFNRQNAPPSQEEYQRLLEELEQEKKKSRFLELLVEEFPLPIFAKNEEARFCVLNKAYKDYFAVHGQELLGTSVLDMEHLDEKERHRYHQEDVDALTKLDTVHYEASYTVGDEQKSTLYWSKAFARGKEEGNALVGTIVDISAQKNLEATLHKAISELQMAQEAIHESKELLESNEQKTSVLQLMLDTMPLIVQLWSEEHDLLECSEEWARIHGLDNTASLLENLHKTNPETQPNGRLSFELMHEHLSEAFRTGYNRFEWTKKSLTNQDIPFDVTLIRKNLHGENVVLAYLKDMREHYKNLQKIRENDEYNRLMLDSSPFGAIIWDSKFNLTSCNKALAQTFGLNEAHEFIDNFDKLVPDVQPNGTPSHELILKELENALKNGSSSTYYVGTSIDGEKIPSEVNTVRLKHHHDYVLVSYIKDLREIEANVKIAKEAEERMRIMFEANPLCANFWKKDFQNLDCNEQAVALFGLKNKQEYLERFFELSPEYQPCGRLTSELAAENMQKTFAEGYTQFEWLHQKLDGEPIPTEITLVRSHYQGEEVVIGYTRDLREHKAMLAEIEATQDDLRKARDIAEQNTKARGEFLANMSHEIRTPMNGILGLLRLLAATSLDPVQEDFVQKTLYSANSLLRIINDILDFSKIEAGKLEMEHIPFNLHDICSELQSLFMPNVNKKGLECVLNEGEFATQTILGDPLRLKQVLYNLTGNAIKFTEKGSVTLNIESSIENNYLLCRFTVKDTGIGLSQEQINNLFSAFSQADTSVTRKYGGTGLGLAISKNFVEMMQGEIWVESVLGQGSSFIFTAKFELSHEEALPISETPQAIIREDADKYRFLLVEDNQINQLIAQEMLQSAGYTSDIAENGQVAIEMLEQKHYDLVLMDIQMPVMDGLTASKTLRKNPKFAKLPIIAMSAHAMTGDKQISLDHGMNDHITKPILPEILFATIDHWLDRKAFSDKRESK